MMAAMRVGMMRSFVVLFAVLVASSTAHAQAPGMTMSFEPSQPAPPMSQEERQILADGEISDGQWGGGVLASVALGFGTGQAVQGRWHDTGWIFTLGESASLVAMIVSMPAAFGDCFDCGPSHQHDQDRAADVLIGSFIVFAGLHIWEIGDAAIGPSEHNQRYRAVRARHPETYTVMPYVVPTHSGGSGGVAGLTLRF